MDNKSKTKKVLEWLESGNIITDVKAVELCQSYRLSGIIFALRQRGYNIQDRWVQNENTHSRYKEYYLID